jgi:seryl-tRNA synthetase
MYTLYTHKTMLDIKFIRENKEVIQEGARKKHSSFDVDALLELDKKRLEILGAVEHLRSEQNKMSDKIAASQEARVRETYIDTMKVVKEQLREKEEQLKEIMASWQLLMLAVPNVPDMSVPEGKDDADNVEIKKWGDIKEFDFEAKDHVELMTNLKMVDFERGTKVHGFRGYFLTGKGVQLSFAIWQYALQFWMKKGFTPVMPPIIARKHAFVGSGFLPGAEEDLYQTQDGDFLAGTAEVPVMAMHSDEVLGDLAANPIKYIGFSPCYRREAGSHSRDTKGLIRVHEFYKWEQVILSEASHQTSVQLHDEINRNTEEFIESLGIPYHTVVNCGGDLGQGQVKKYDIELWVPKEGKYREISSASYFHDFQTRRSNIKYKGADGVTRFAHSLNCTAIPTPRILVSLIENYQQADGSILIPEVLRPFMGEDSIK